MKKTILTAAALIAITSTASAADIKMTDYSFGKGNYDMGGSITVTLENVSNKEVVAAKYTIICNDAFGDRALGMKVKDRSLNLKPGASDSSTWVPNMFSKSADILKNNKAENFECFLEDVKTVN